MPKQHAADRRFTLPKHLSQDMRSWVRDIIDRYPIESHHFRILILAGEAWDSCVAARKVLRAKGVSYLDRFGAPRSRPEVAALRDSRLAFLRCLAALGIQNEDPEDDEDAGHQITPLARRRKEYG
jgi:hypothetical protein